MWGSRTWNRLFNNKTAPAPLNLNSDFQNQNTTFGIDTKAKKDINMQGDEIDYVQIVPYDSYEFQKAKQRASIRWLLGKAYNNKAPEELTDPFYKDHEGDEHLKPHVVQGLSNAELYCLALCNIYADPNYSQLSPWGIVQALARKGVYVQRPSDGELTETVLIQNTPLKISAHMLVIEAMMVLQVKEIISNDRIVNTVQRYGPSVHPLRLWLGSGEMPSDSEEALLLWINRAVLAIKEYIQKNNAHEHNLSSTQVENWTQLPLFQDLSDLADGVGLCSLLAFYCQEELALAEITVPNPGEPLNVSDSLWNLQLVQRVCKDSLPYNVNHFALEDVLYLHESMKQNMLNFLADLFNQLELQPSPNVKLLGSHQIPIRPGELDAFGEGLTSEGVRLRRGYIHQAPNVIPDLRPSLYQAATSTAFSADRRGNSRPQSATSTPKRHNAVQEKSRKTSTINIFGETSSGRRSPSSASVVSVPIRRSGTPQEYNEKTSSDRSNNKDQQRYYAHSRSSDDSEDFVVHRGRNVPTLSQVIRSVSPSSQDERSSPTSRVSVSRSVSVNEGDPEGPAAGRPSNWNANKTSYAGRRSRRNSITEADSQLTVENFGGSQDNLNKIVIGRNPDKQPAIVTDATSSPVRYLRRQSSQEPSDYNNDSPSPAPYVETRQSDNRAVKVNDRDEGQQHRLNNSSSGGNGDVVFYGKKKLNHAFNSDEEKSQSRSPYYDRESHDLAQEHGSRSMQPGSEGNNVTVYVMGQSGDMEVGFDDSPHRSTSLSNLSRLSDLPNKPVNIVYLQSDNNSPASAPRESNHSYNVTSSNGWGDSRSRQAPVEYNTMPAPPRDSYYNTPSRSPHHHQQQQHYRSPGPPSHQSTPPYRQQYGSPYKENDDYLQSEDVETDDIAAQLAAIRLKLEDKRKRIETEKSRMEAVASKQQHKLGKAAYFKAINKGRGHEGASHTGLTKQSGDTLDVVSARKKQLTLKDLESKWLNKTEEPCRTPEIENMDLNTYQQSLARMDTSLTELESDISRLAGMAHQQENIQRQFFLHGDPQSDSAKRKTWNTMPNRAGAPLPQARSQWGTSKPFAESSSSDESTPRGMYNGDTRTKPSSNSNPNRSGSNSMSYTSPSFRLHSTADTQGNRLFNNNKSGDQADSDIERKKPTPPPRQSKSSGNIYHAPLPTPPPDDMEPQSVSFVQDDAVPISNEMSSISSKKSSLHQITSGSKTYRITPESGSPPRPSAHRLFAHGRETHAEASITSSDENTSMNERGFYITFENEGPKRPKPPLRMRSPAKRRDGSSGPNDRTSIGASNTRDLTTEYIQSIVDHVPIPADSDDEIQQQHVSRRQARSDSEGIGDQVGGELVIDEKPHLDSDELYEMEKKKERILLQSLKRQQRVEDSRRLKEMEMQRKREVEAMKQEEKLRKREEEKARRQAILETYRLKKAEETDKDSKGWEVQESSAKKFMRPKSSSNIGPRPRPKTIHLSEVDSAGAKSSHGVLRRSDSQSSSTSLARSYGKRGSSNTLYSESGGGSRNRVRDPWGSTSSLNQDSNRRRTTSNTYDRGSRRRDNSTSRLEVRSRRDSYLGSQDSLAHRVNSTSSLLDAGPETDSSTGGGGGHKDSDSGVGTCSPPHRQSPSPKSRIPPKRVHSAGPQPQPSCSLPSPSGTGPGSLPPGLISRRNRGFDDGASDISSVASSNMDYSGLRLYKQPTAKSNRSIMLNAVEYCVFPGVVNRDHKSRVLDEINRSESKHFLIMFRDAGCQFRALYSYVPERDEIVKLFGVGPKQVTDDMFEKFFKYNSGGKCFSQVHTKHLTVTIDAFTIHNALWQGKRAPAAKTRDYALVI